MAINNPRDIHQQVRSSSYVAIGDSITALSSTFTSYSNYLTRMNYADLGAAMSGQRFQFIRNAGVGGQTAAQIAARIQSDAIANLVSSTSGFPQTGGLVLILAGANDMPTSATTPQTSIVSMAQQCLAANCLPVFSTLPPNNGSSPYHQNINQFNAWLKKFCADNGFTCIDMYSLLVDPTSGNYASGYYLDGTHPNNAGVKAMAQLLANALGPLLPNRAPYLIASTDDFWTLAPNGLFLSPGAGSGPTNWFLTGSATGSVSSVAGTGNDIGNWMTVSCTNGTANQSAVVYCSISSGSGWAVGDTLLFTCRLKTSGMEAQGLSYTVQVQMGNSPYTPAAGVYNWTADLSPAITVAFPWVVPAATTSIQIQFQVTVPNPAPTGPWSAGVLSIGQVGLFDLTKGVATVPTLL